MRLRKAKLCDAGEIHALLQPYMAQGLLLPRSLGQLCSNIRDFTVLEDETGRIVGAAALHFFDEDVAEIQSLAVARTQQGAGYGRKLVEALLHEAKEHRVWKVLAMSHAPEFFLGLGFDLADLGQFPQKVMGACMTCAKFNSCKQIAVVRDVFARRQTTARAEAPRRQACLA